VVPAAQVQMEEIMEEHLRIPDQEAVVVPAVEDLVR
jgi:hypothetical protein